jgi:hypothetical protein
LSYDDPFDNATDEKEIPVVQEVEISADKDGNDDALAYSLTFKGLGTHRNRWLVVRFNSAAAGLAAIKEPEFKELLDYSRKIEEYDAGQYSPASPAPQAPAQQSYGAPPQGSQEAPNGEKRFCSHGEMVFKSGVSKAGNNYKLFACTAPREQQCAAQYLNKR